MHRKKKCLACLCYKERMFRWCILKNIRPDIQVHERKLSLYYAEKNIHENVQNQRMTAR